MVQNQCTEQSEVKVRSSEDQSRACCSDTSDHCTRWFWRHTKRRTHPESQVLPTALACATLQGILTVFFFSLYSLSFLRRQSVYIDFTIHWVSISCLKNTGVQQLFSVVAMWKNCLDICQKSPHLLSCLPRDSDSVNRE